MADVEGSINASIHAPSGKKKVQVPLSFVPHTMLTSIWLSESWNSLSNGMYSLSYGPQHGYPFSSVSQGVDMPDF